MPIAGSDKAYRTCNIGCRPRTSPLGEFIARAQTYGYTKRVIRIRELGTRIVYLRRGGTERAELVDLPPIRESDRLTRAAVESLCERAKVPKEDFGLW